MKSIFIKASVCLISAVILSSCHSVYKCYCEWTIAYPDKEVINKDTLKVYACETPYDYKPEVEKDSNAYHIIWGPNQVYSGSSTTSKYPIKIINFKIPKK